MKTTEADHIYKRGSGGIKRKRKEERERERERVMCGCCILCVLVGGFYNEKASQRTKLLDNTGVRFTYNTKVKPSEE